MSIEKLQEKIRKFKNPSIVDLTAAPSQIPPSILEQEQDFLKAYAKYCKEILSSLKTIIPAVRFSYSWFSSLGAEGLILLLELLQEAKKHGYYVLLDGVGTTSLWHSECVAERLMGLPCDGLILSAYAGTDAVKPYVDRMMETGKSVFVVIRTANKSAAQLQDLMTGSRLVHMATADIVNRLGESMIGKSGYSQIAGVGAATSAESLRTLRSKYKNLFLLIDGYDYPGANAKNCSYAFDKLGHGAAACAGNSILTAWTESREDYLICAVRAAERMRKNLTRYITIL